MQPIFHPYDKKYLDLLEILYEQRISKEDYPGSLEVCLEILKHYHKHYPQFDINTGLMEMKAAKLCVLMDKLDEAEKHLVIGKDILEVTHGKTHQLVTISVGRIELDLAKSKKIQEASTRLLKVKGKLAKSGWELFLNTYVMKSAEIIEYVPIYIRTGSFTMLWLNLES